ncbi:short chain dehydrogenase family protein [Apiospora marii]|uniref:short chain dehydrogenase family protein n=1 Tax=Apiospora marii TaxID=335849 RepID=UPI00312E302D
MPQTTAHPNVTESRPLGTLENFFKWLADQGRPLNRGHWTIHLILDLAIPQSIADPALHLRSAWQALRIAHPHLGAVVTHSTETNQESPPGRLVLGGLDLDEWAKTTFTVCDQECSMDQLLSGLGPQDTATCYWVPSSSQLLLRSDHWRVDGSGMVMLGHELLAALTMVLEHGPKPALDHLESIVQFSSRRPAIREREHDPAVSKAADTLIADFLQGQPSIGLPALPHSEAAIPDRTGFAIGRLDMQTTAQVLTACKTNGYTVTSAVHAAIIRVTATFPQHPLCKSYAAFTPFDLRPTISAASSSDVALPVCGLYLLGPPVRIDDVTTKDFAGIANHLCDTYRRDPAHFWSTKDGQGEDATISLLDLEEALTSRVSAIVQAPVPEGWPPAQTPDLSSLGVIDSRIQPEYGSHATSKLQVKNFWIGTEMLGRNIQFHVWTWNGQLTLSACFNQSYYERQFVDGVVDQVLKELREGCRIEQ